MVSKKAKVAIGIIGVLAIVGIVVAFSGSDSGAGAVDCGSPNLTWDQFTDCQYEQTLADINDEYAGGFGGGVESDGEMHRPGNKFGAEQTPIIKHCPQDYTC